MQHELPDDNEKHLGLQKLQQMAEYAVGKSSMEGARNGTSSILLALEF